MTGRAAPRSSPAAGRCASRSPSCCWRSPTCCCSTSPPTISISKPATGWKNISQNYPNAFVLISHDRYFLDVTVNKIAEIWNKRVYFYTGNYDKFLAQKTERNAQLEAAYRNQRDRIEQLEAFINRFRYQATKAKQVQSRIKELEKIERIEIPPDEKTIHFTFPQPKPSGRIVAEFEDVAKSYGRRTTSSFPRRQLHHRARRPHRAGRRERRRQIDADQAAGRHGAGDLTANYTLGHNVDAGLLRAGSVQGARSRRAHARRSRRRRSARSRKTELRSLLGCFLFSEDDVFKQIGVLSGGERNRYALARMLLHPANFLLLDEPTNHLDMRAKDVLLDALKKYTGTVVFVSHDRYFIDKLATRVFEVGDGEVDVFPGNYEDYLWRKQGGQKVAPTLTDVPGAKKSEPAAPSFAASAKSSSSNNGHQPANGNRPDAEPESPKKRLNPIKRKQMQDRVHELEAKISSAESAIAELETALQNFVSAEESQRQSQELDQHKADHAALIKEWEETAASLQEGQ